MTVFPTVKNWIRKRVEHVCKAGLSVFGYYFTADIYYAILFLSQYLLLPAEIHTRYNTGCISKEEYCDINLSIEKHY